MQGNSWSLAFHMAVCVPRIRDSLEIRHHHRGYFRLVRPGSRISSGLWFGTARPPGSLNGSQGPLSNPLGHFQHFHSRYKTITMLEFEYSVPSESVLLHLKVLCRVWNYNRLPQYTNAHNVVSKLNIHGNAFTLFQRDLVLEDQHHLMHYINNNALFNIKYLYCNRNPMLLWFYSPLLPFNAELWDVVDLD